MTIFASIIKFCNKNNENIVREKSNYSNPNDINNFKNNFNENTIQKWIMPPIVFLGPVQTPAYI
ncbi:hypothetical protein RB653_009909 [Dictyostelium firmibasis]|uniref:Uncharacterized protein n=1 Tax=Dictyostelium firmibasis TaxID=79012 RepID=A0AAN7YP41_9MYCE